MKQKMSERIAHFLAVSFLVVIGLIWIVVGSLFFALGALVSATIVSPYHLGHHTGRGGLVAALELLQRGKPKKGA